MYLSGNVGLKSGITTYYAVSSLTPSGFCSLICNPSQSSCEKDMKKMHVKMSFMWQITILGDPVGICVFILVN